MSTTKTTSIRIRPDILEKINEKCPNVNRSLLINNIFDYIFSQNNDVILSFTKKVT